jgi:hypothetical protein
MRSYDESDCEGMYNVVAKMNLRDVLYDITDIDECANNTLNNCSASNHQVCRNVLGSFHCDCDVGYEAGIFDNTMSSCQGQLISTIIAMHGIIIACNVNHACMHAIYK